MAVNHHPTDDILTHYGLGKLEGAANETVEGHLTTCTDCRQRVAALSSDGFLDRLQHAARPAQMDGFQHSRPNVEKSVPFVEKPSDIPPVLLSLEQFTEIRRLGHGGMGEIFLAKNIRMDREEVLKVMSRAMLERSGAAARFEREIKSIGKLNHPNIVTTYSSLQVGDTVILTMEYAGEDLAKIVEKKGPLPIPRACYFIHQAALGLQYAHEKNMVHRDIKPSNLMALQVGSKWQVKILDFGLAKTRFDPNGSTADAAELAKYTQTGQSLGTPAYMPPEQIRDSKSVDIRADIYSLGGTLYYLLTGRPPFVEENALSLIFAHGEKIATPANELRADVPAALADLIARMLAKDPKDRPQTPAEVAKALVPFIRPASKSQDTQSQSGISETDVVDKTETSEPQVASQPPRRRTTTWIALGLLAFALAALGAASIFIKTKDGTIELANIDPDAEVFVDGNKVSVTWNDGKQSAEIRVKPGTRQIEVKQGEISVIGETVEIDQNGRKVLTARRKEEAEPVKEEKKSDPQLQNADDKPKVNRKARQRGPGQWVINNNVLTLRANHSGLVFGDDSWTDYEFEFDYRVIIGPPEVNISIRRSASLFGLGGITMKVGTEARTIDLWVDGGEKPVDSARRPLRTSDWVHLRMRIQGNMLQCFAGPTDTPQKIPIFTRFVRAPQSGRVELGNGFPRQPKAAVIEFKNVQVKDLDGKILWTGFPELP